MEGAVDGALEGIVDGVRAVALLNEDTLEGVVEGISRGIVECVVEVIVCGAVLSVVACTIKGVLPLCGVTCLGGGEQRCASVAVGKVREWVYVYYVLLSGCCEPCAFFWSCSIFLVWLWPSFVSLCIFCFLLPMHWHQAHFVGDG